MLYIHAYPDPVPFARFQDAGQEAATLRTLLERAGLDGCPVLPGSEVLCYPLTHPADPYPSGLAALVRRRVVLRSPLHQLVQGLPPAGSWQPGYLEGLKPLADGWQAFLAGTLPAPPGPFGLQLGPEDLEVLLEAVLAHPQFQAELERLRQVTLHAQGLREEERALAAWLAYHQIEIRWSPVRQGPFGERVATAQGRVGARAYQARLECIPDAGPLLYFQQRPVVREAPLWRYLDSAVPLEAEPGLFLEAAIKTAPPPLLEVPLE